MLESLYIAGTGRSFRHQEAGPFIRHSQKAALIVVKIKNPQTGLVHTLGLERSKNQRIISLDGRNVDRRSALVDVLPIQWIVPEAREFLEKGPEIRRRFVDLGLFHVEHGALLS